MVKKIEGLRDLPEPYRVPSFDVDVNNTSLLSGFGCPVPLHVFFILVVYPTLYPYSFTRPPTWESFFEYPMWCPSPGFHSHLCSPVSVSILSPERPLTDTVPPRLVLSYYFTRFMDRDFRTDVGVTAFRTPTGSILPTTTRPPRPTISTPGQPSSRIRPCRPTCTEHLTTVTIGVTPGHPVTPLALGD